MGRLVLMTALAVQVLAAGCGGGDEPVPDPGEAVRAAAAAFVDSLRAGRWEEACDRMSVEARMAVADERRDCARALRGGAALPDEELDTVARQLAGAPVRIAGGKATLGPVGDLPEPLRFERDADRWVIAP
jgi:hypothetical protein